MYNNKNISFIKRVGCPSSVLPLGSQPQHIVVPNRAEVVTAPILVKGRPLHPDVNRLSNTSISVLLLIFLLHSSPHDILVCPDVPLQRE